VHLDKQAAVGEDAGEDLDVLLHGLDVFPDGLALLHREHREELKNRT